MSEHILIIEDDLDIANIERDYLMVAGYDVTIMTNGTEGIEAALNTPVDLIILDVMLPEMDGFEVLKYMNQNHLIEEVPVMIISIDKDDKSIEKAYELGVSGYITRPFSSAVVLKKINNIISHYKRQKKTYNHH